MKDSRYDVVILGAGLAGLSLARQLLLETDRTVLLLDRLETVPGPRQKVGEATVQLSGYYFSKVLELEAHLLTEHYMKYNLRFLWPTPGRANDALEDYSQAYIRNFSNIASYQIDRNKFEAELLRVNRDDERFRFAGGTQRLEVALDDRGPHVVTYTIGRERHRIEADWVVDTTGRGKLLAKQLDLGKPNEIRHGAFFWWIDGLLDIEGLTDLSARERRLHPSRREVGHLPFFLGTNHFMVEGAWFWIIPLHGKTSLGVVFDRELAETENLVSVDKATDWVCRRFPLLRRELPREALSFGGFKDFSYDCRQTISPQRWAIAGEAGRFSDPLYSPGGDLIAIHNTLIVDAITSADDAQLMTKCARAEQLMRAAYSAYEPSYSTSYDALGDPEVFSLKYSWELAVYVAFYVFPFINGLLTDPRFQAGFLRSFAELGPINHGLHRTLSAFFQWRKQHGVAIGEPVFFDFTRMCALRQAEKTFYEIGIGPAEARQILREQGRSLREMARYVVAWVAASVLDEPAMIDSRGFVESLDPDNLDFDPESWEETWRRVGTDPERYPWTLDTSAAAPFAAARSERDELAALTA